MMNQEKLLQDLFSLRETIKNQAKLKGEKSPMVCSDNAIHEMARLCPRKIEDFHSVAGLGKIFVENYAERFLDLILKSVESPMEKSVLMDAKARETLKELEKKLVDVNRKNCLLYLAKLPAKRGIDLFSCDCSNPLGLIFLNVSMQVCSIEAQSQYKKYTQLLREIQKDIRDKGQNDLYVAYPFVKGRLPGENFDIRCPLALFPMVAERDSLGVSLKLDEDRDILYNSTLLLAFFKFNGMNNPLPNDVIEDISSLSFLDSLLSFYKENGLTILKEDTELQKFKEYSAGEFPSYKNGELYLEPCMVLGKFPTRSGMIQKDFDDILESGQINELLNILLQNIDDLDFYQDFYSGIEKDQEKEEEKLKAISERDLTYINDLNSSQEEVLSAIDYKDSVVVQGPPGTGKSQVITSLISDYVSQDKTVLMVSEKKTALDVVYSRLGNLSAYALLIDDIGNKELFYAQLEKMLDFNKNIFAENPDLDTLSSVIDEDVKKLEEISDKLYSVGSFGIEPYKIYRKLPRLDLENPLERSRLTAVRESLSKTLLSGKGQYSYTSSFSSGFTASSASRGSSKASPAYPISYEELTRLKDKFSKEALTSNLIRYYELKDSYPWMERFREHLSDFDMLNISEKLKEYEEVYQEWQRKNFIVKLFSKGRVNDCIYEISKFFSNTENRELEALLKNQFQALKDSATVHGEYQQLKGLYESLSKQEKEYFEAINSCSQFYEHSLSKANTAVYDAILFDFISRFESENRELFQNIKDYQGIIEALRHNMNEKKELTKKKLQVMLSTALENLRQTKHYGEMRRVMENKRKWSVNKFIKRFGFELFKSIRIWLLTPEVVSEIMPLEKGLFDLVVFDEASQMYVENGVPSILRAKKLVIAGDHKQLRPSKIGSGRVEINEDLPEDMELSAALEEESLLDVARFKFPDILLNFHYRSKYEELIAFSNYAFYKGRLYVSPNMKKAEKPPIEVHKLEDGIWVERANLAEAKHIVNLLKEFFRNRQRAETIGVITFNVSQRDLIEDLIDEECGIDEVFAAQIRAEIIRKKDGEDIGYFVKNIESVQGDERDVIVFSIGYAKNENGRIVRQWGWLNQKGGENRLNVAISRAKEKVYIVTSIFPEELQVEDIKNDGPRFLKKYLEYAFAVSKGDKEGAKEVLLSFGDQANAGTSLRFDSGFEEEVYQRLTEKGYEVDSQIGIGGYSIDLGIKKDGHYVLGIECDGKLYHSSKSVRERDLHRQKYLESRGWKIHRIWSSNWWKNPEGEIAKISKILETQ